MDDFRAEMSALTAARDKELARAIGQREKQAHPTRRILVAGGVASALRAALGATLLIRGIVSRLRVVTDNARRVAEGEDLEPVSGQDEIAQLASKLERSAQKPLDIKHFTSVMDDLLDGAKAS